MMPQLNNRYVLMPALQQVIHDKIDGSLLTYGRVTFYKDEARTVLKPVYQISRTPSNEYIYTQLQNPLLLSGIGSYVDEQGNNIIPYLYPYDENGNIELYYIRVESQQGELQFDVEAWPNQLNGQDGVDNYESSDNQVSNPQFSQVLFTEDLVTGQHVYTVTGSNKVTPVAPGWDIVTTGTGTVTVSQEEPTAAGLETNPFYCLDIQSAGISSIYLRQRFYNAPRMYQNQYLNGSLAINSQDGSSFNVNMGYYASNGSSYTILSETVLGSTAFQDFSRTVLIFGQPVDPAPASTGYFDLRINFNVGVHLQLTSVQLVSVQDENDELQYIPTTPARQMDHLFHYYYPWLAMKPVTNVLTAWDFPLNPAQFGGPTHTPGISANAATGNAQYVWDQTICGRVAANYNVTRSSTTDGIQFTATGANSAFFMMQYLTLGEVQALMQSPLSVNVLCRKGATGNSTMRVYLFRASTATPFPSLPAGLGTLAANGVFTLTAAGWTEIPRGIAGQAQAEIAASTSVSTDYGFNQWQVTDAAQINDSDRFAIVVTFSTPTNATVITVDSINLCIGNIPCRPAAEAGVDVLRQCQFYYEKSYYSSDVPGAVTSNGAIIVPAWYSSEVKGNPVPSSSTIGYLGSFSFGFSEKRLVPTFANDLYFYSPYVATQDQFGVSLQVSNVPVSTGVTAGSFVTLDVAGTARGHFPYTGNLSITGSTTKAISLTSLRTGDVMMACSTTANAEVFVIFHYVIDQRLGVV